MLTLAPPNPSPRGHDHTHRYEDVDHKDTFTDTHKHVSVHTRPAPHVHVHGQPLPPVVFTQPDPTHSRCSDGTLRKLPAFSWVIRVLTNELGTWAMVGEEKTAPVLHSHPRAGSCPRGAGGNLILGVCISPAFQGRRAIALLAWQGSWQHSAHPMVLPPLRFSPQDAPALWNSHPHPCSLSDPSSPLPGLPTSFAAPSQDPDGPSSPPGSQDSHPQPQAPRGLTLTATAGSGRGSRAGPRSPHTEHCLWSRSNSEDTFPLGVSRPPPPPAQPAAAVAEFPPLPCPLTPAEAAASLCPPSSAQVLATTSPTPGDPPCRQLARSAPASLSSFSVSLQSVFLPLCLRCLNFHLCLFPCFCVSLLFCISDSVSLFPTPYLCVFI